MRVAPYGFAISQAMAEQIEQLGMALEANQNQIEELQGKYNTELHQSSDLRKKLLATEETLEHTSNLLASTKEDLKLSHYGSKEKEFIISVQKQAESTLMHETFVLQSKFEKAMHENTSIFSKIAREEDLTNKNKVLVNNFQADVAGKLESVCRSVVSSNSEKKHQLQQLEEFCQTSLSFQDKAFLQAREQVSFAQDKYFSHLESLQNAVQLHKVGPNGSLEEISLVTKACSESMVNLLAEGEGAADNIFRDLQDQLSAHRCDIADFSRELRERFLTNLARTREMPNLILDLLDKLGGEIQT